MNILVIGAHPDDEVVGMGATIKKLSKKNKIFLCIITDGTTAQYDDKKMIKVRRDACMKSSKLLGISKVKFLDFPDMMAGRISQLEIKCATELHLHFKALHNCSSGIHCNRPQNVQDMCNCFKVQLRASIAKLHSTIFSLSKSDFQLFTKLCKKCNDW